MAANSTNGWAPEGLGGGALPATSLLPEQANAQAGMGQYLFFDANGNVGPTDGTVPGLVAAGVVFPAKLMASATTAGVATVQAWTGYGGGNPSITGAGDVFTAADVCTPAFAATVDTLGKKSNLAGVNRPLAGLAIGLYPDGTPRAWVGPIAHTIARSLLVSNAVQMAAYPIADAIATTAIAEQVIPRHMVHGIVTGITYTGAAIAASNTDYVTVTISKRDVTGATVVVMGTYDSRAANQGAATAFAPVSFGLSAVLHALELLETDTVTITTVKGGAGKVMTGAILVNGKAI